MFANWVAGAGFPLFQIATIFVLSKENRCFYFDSFEGLSEYQTMDLFPGLKEDVAARRKQFACSLEEVRENLKEFFFIQYHKGWIPQRFDEVKDRKFSFVHVDVDLYQPIRDSFHFFYRECLKAGS